MSNLFLSKSTPPMSRQQQELSHGGLALYKARVWGNRSWIGFFTFEAYNLFFSNLPTFLGFAVRRMLLPFFLQSSGAKLSVERSVTIRQPQQISFGRGVFIGEYACIDAQSSADSEGAITLADNCFVGRSTIIAAKGGRIALGAACNVGTNCRIATNSSIEIGESVLIAANCYLGPGNHGVRGKDHPIIEQPMDIRGGVKIGDHAWIGTHTTVVDGVKIGAHAVVGAHSLVLEDVPEGAIVAGTPAKILRFRE